MNSVGVINAATFVAMIVITVILVVLAFVKFSKNKNKPSYNDYNDELPPAQSFSYLDYSDCSSQD